MSTMIKICGLTTPETIDAAVAAGATHVGLVHYPPSPRHLSLDTAARLRQRVPTHVKAVLLLVNADPELTAQAISQVRPDVIQFHGSETPEWVGLVREKTSLEIWKAVGVRDAESLRRSARYRNRADRIILDAPARDLPGGNGMQFAWEILETTKPPMDWGLAGGLDPTNVAEAIRMTGAPLVDSSSGVENAPGRKDVDLIRSFCHAARTA